jgi:aspartyl-tRNA(Asn)/glutamyl-tRNA(Gln) amidotransferase subunit B
MQEGSLRCDVNISLREQGSRDFGTRVEIKNINSFAFVEKAINYEIARQTELLRRGEQIRMETRRFDSAKGVTELMRTKETADDYRYLPEPDLLAIKLSDAEIKAIGDALPELPAAQAVRLIKSYGIRQKDAEILAAELSLATFFEAVAEKTKYPQSALNLLLTDLMPHCTADPFSSPVSGDRIAELANLLGDGEINSATAKKLLTRLIKEDFSPVEIVEKEGLAQIRDTDRLQALVESAMQKLPQAVIDWQNGKTAAMRSLQGRIMAESGGRADPILAEKLLLANLEAQKNQKEENLS